MLRSGIITFGIILAAGIAFTWFERGTDNAAGPCETPLTYRIGEIDSRFNIDERQIREVLNEVERLWSDALNRDLVRHSDSGRVVIHFIYSEQQRLFEEERTTSTRIEGKDVQLSVREKEYNRYMEMYEQELADYRAMLSDYNKQVDEHNGMVSRLQGRRLSAEEEQKIKRNERHLENLKSQIDRKNREVESLRRKVNRYADELNKLNIQRNELVSEYNTRFAEPKKFDQGRYIREGDDERINIYQFGNLQSLKAVLAHEIGHALGIGHVENPASVMHEMMSEHNVSDLNLSNEDIDALQQRCAES